MEKNKKRCSWVKANSQIYLSYHDQQWGVVLRNDRDIFELFSLETQACGLSWLTILNKKYAYKKAFDDFDIQKVASYGQEKIEDILKYDVIKYSKKLHSIVHNAKCFLQIIDEFGSLYNFFYAYVDFKHIKNDIKNSKNAPTTSEISDKITKELKKRGFKYVGSVTIYAFMQACGMVNDHENSCFCKNK